MRIDLNADVGEIDGEEPLYELVSSVNIACGGHAGDRESMSLAIERARTHGCRIGAHPGYRDRENFGRRALSLSPEVVKNEMIEQIRTLEELAGELTHVKPHGALYNQAAKDRFLAHAVAEACEGRTLVGAAGSLMIAAARTEGIGFVEEGFADRAYMSDGSLAPRGTPGALLEDPARAAAQALAIARGEPFGTADGGEIVVSAGTLCIHGDTPGALGIARAVRAMLEGSGIAIAPPVIERRA